MCSRGGLLDFENEEYVVFCLLSGQGPASSVILLLWSFCYYGVSAIMEFLSTGDELQLFGLGPIYLLPHYHLSSRFC